MSSGTRRSTGPGELDVLIGRLTFSAAANFATESRRRPSATFVGEPMGGSPNLYGDARPTDLPVRRADRLRGDALLADEHSRRRADHDRARPGDPVLVGGLPCRSRSGPRRGDRRDPGRRPMGGGYPRPVTESPDLLIRGGTVVTAEGSRPADLAVAGGRISAIEPDLGGSRGPRRARSIDATGMLVLPGAVDVHTHTRVATDAQPDRFFQDSVAAAFGGTTTFLSFNNPGTGSSPAAERSLRDRRSRVAGRDRRRQRHRHRAEPRHQRPRRRSARRASGHHRGRRRDLEGVHGLRLPAPR